jgi:glycosyltransferase involved in cell wall biosynthesis
VEGVDTTKSSARIWLDRLTRRRGLRFVAVCGAVSRVATKRDWVAPDDLVVIPTGIDLDYWQCDGRRPAVRAEWQVSEATPVVGWAGRLAPEKNVPALLAALETLPGWRLAVAGDGPMRSSMQREIRDRDLSGRVIDLGELVDMRPFLEAIDVFALPSTEEGLPVAMLEAMAMQRPVVAAPVGGIPELIVPGENGLLVDADDPAALARSILSAHRTPELGSRGRQSVRASHSLVAMLDAYDALWRSVIGSTIHR